LEQVALNIYVTNNWMYTVWWSVLCVSIIHLWYGELQWNSWQAADQL